jgi:hypothetical protein
VDAIFFKYRIHKWKKKTEEPRRFENKSSNAQQASESNAQAPTARCQGTELSGLNRITLFHFMLEY